MQRTSDILKTEHLVLRTWRLDDLEAFSHMHADPNVMHDQGGPISLDESRAKFQRYVAMYDQFGFSRYCVKDLAGSFVGYVGICPRHNDGIVGGHDEIGWRLNTAYWGKGYATEAARACLDDFKKTFPTKEVISYTTAENIRSQKVMMRLNMTRAPKRDFDWIEADGRKLPLRVWTTGNA